MFRSTMKRRYGISFSFEGSFSKRRNGSIGLSDISFSPQRTLDPKDDSFTGLGLDRKTGRSAYLRSYQFSREESVQDKIKSSLTKLKAAVWAVIACNYTCSLARTKEAPKHNACPANHCMASETSPHVCPTAHHFI
eukprot:c12290_g1_i1 orf=161-568(+)